MVQPQAPINYLNVFKTAVRKVPVECYPVVAVVGLACGLAGYRGLRMYNELEDAGNQFEHSRFNPNSNSEDDAHPITEWYVHNPNSRGWQSPRGISIWPQEIGLQFEEVVNIQKIQFLSHQCKIATIIELFVGNVPERQHQSYGQAEFKRLGYMSLDDNSKTDFKARELKSVHVRATGLYLKLLIHKPHPNHLNVYQQVGIIAVNIQGEPAPSLKSSPTITPDGHPLDPVTSQKIFSLNLAKENAARVENYELAMQLKDVISYLRKVGAEIGRLDQKKKMAVEVENYEAAAALKKEIEQMRAIAYSNIPDYPEVSPSRTPSPSELLSPRLAEQVVNPGFFQDFRGGPSSLNHASSADALLQGDVPKKSKNDILQDFNMPRVSSIPTMSMQQHRPPPGPASMSYDSRVPLSINNSFDPRSSSHFESRSSPPSSSHSHSHHSSSHSHQSHPPSSLSISAYEPRPISSSYPISNPNHDVISDYMRASTSGDFVRPHDAGPPSAGGYARDAGAGNFARPHGDTTVVSAGGYARDSQPSVSASAGYARSQGDVDVQGILPRQTSAKDLPRTNSYEDRPLPTAKYGFGAETPRTTFDSVPAVDDRPIKAKEKPRKQPDKKIAVEDDEPPPIPKDAAHLLDISSRCLYFICDHIFDYSNVFGEENVRGLYDSAWAGREQALKSIELSLPLKGVDSDTALRSCCSILTRSFADKIPQIYLAALSLLQAVLNEYGDTVRGPNLRSQLSGLMPNIVAKTADNNTREIRDASFLTLLSFAQHPNVGPHLVGSHVAKPAKNQSQWKVILGRIGVLIELIPVFGLADGSSYSHPVDDPPLPGLDSDMVCNFICNAFDSPNSDVRSAAVQAMAEVYRLSPQKAQQVTSGVKPKLLELIRTAFKEADEQKTDQPPVFYEQKPKNPEPAATKQKSSSNNNNNNINNNNKQSQPPPKSKSTNNKDTKETKETNTKQAPPPQKQKQTNNNNNNLQSNNIIPAEPALSNTIPSSSNNHHTETTEPENESFQAYTPESRCQFCGLEDENFTEDLLDQHYMRECPMLCECDCEQVIEISCLNEHQLTECDNAPQRAACPNCKMALPEYDLEAHIAECPPSWQQAAWQQCPLCYDPKPLTSSKMWFNHLSNECPNNPRNDLAAATYQ